jgi:hypothetical protein
MCAGEGTTTGTAPRPCAGVGEGLPAGLRRSCPGPIAQRHAIHRTKGQQVAFCGRLDPRPWTGRDGSERVSLEVHGVELEYGAKPCGSGQATAPEPGAD